MLSKLNSRLSFGARLSVMSALFVAATGVGVATIVSNSLQQISFSEKERDGTAYLREIFGAWQSGSTNVGDDELNERFNATDEFNAFTSAAPGADRDAAAQALMSAVADGSNLTLDPELASYNLQDAISIRIPEMLAEEGLLDAAVGATGDSQRPFQLYRAIEGLKALSDDAAAALGRAIDADATGLVSDRLGQLRADLQRIGHTMAEEESGAMTGATLSGASETTEADFPRIIAETWNASADDLDAVLQHRIDGLWFTLWLQLGLVGLVTAAAGALGVFIARTSAKSYEEATFKGAAFDTSPVPMIVANREFKITYVNNSLTKMLKDNIDNFRTVFPNFNPDNIVGQSIDVFHKNPSHQRQLLSDPSRLPYKRDTTIGDLKFGLNASAVYNQSRECVGYVVEFPDVTAERLNAGMLQALGRAQAIIEFNMDGTIVNANENFCQTLGYSLSEIKGKHHSMFADAAYARSPEYKAFWDKLNRGDFDRGKHRRVGKGGREVWIEATYNPILDQNGKAYKVVKFATDVTAIEHERAAAEAERAQRAEEQAKVVRGLAQGLSQMAAGNLTARIEDAFPGEYEMLRTDFNNAMNELQEAMSTIVGSAGGIRSGAGEISQAADDLSRRTEQQAASLEETAAALDEITATVRKSAESAKQANTVVAGARADAEASGQVVNGTVSAMAEIEKSAKQISQIIGVIDEIAFQTNLLALNAGVEAARAGEAGRGFAVVASEVRALAQRSSEAAKEIKTLISASSQQVEAGVELVGEAGKALQLIIGKVSEINGLMSEITASAQEQSTALAEVNAAINNMDQTTQQNAAMVEESTAASHSLTKEAEELMGLVSRFKIGAGGGASSRAPSRPTGQPIAHQKQRVAKFASEGNAAVKSDDGWTEF